MSDSDDDFVYIPAKKRREAAQKLSIEPLIKPKGATLLEQHRPKSEPTAEEKALEEENAILEAVTSQTALKAVQELAQDIHYLKPIETSWTPPKFMSERSSEIQEIVRAKHHVIVEGENPPPLLKSFELMKIPRGLIKILHKRNIKVPSAIQMQGLPVAFSGRDMIGIASTGSGKTLVFTLPLLLFSIEQELAIPFISKEGPYALIIGPSRELARQTYEFLTEIAEKLHSKCKFPRIQIGLAIGGEAMKDQIGMSDRGLHVLVATPGRLLHLLNNRNINLDVCRHLCLDEADRMLDLGFEEDIRNIISFFKGQRQTLLFSATMPKKIQNFAKSALVSPLIVNVGRAGAACLNVIQNVEYVKEDAKISSILLALQKSAPPVLIFAEKKKHVDLIHEYLLLKGVDAAAIHGGLSQEERKSAVDGFRSGSKDVLVATDVASKGLDFPSVKHVINFDMPEDIESYVHRIGRTGRQGKGGMATTFVNKNCDESLLIDLKHLLVEAGQDVPKVLEPLGADDNISSQSEGCSFCGGLGHRIAACPRLEAQQNKQVNNILRNDYLASGSADW